ncbi:MAG: RluA family pseudouridine synthase [Acidimicrobiia bacterium]
MSNGSLRARIPPELRGERLDRIVAALAGVSRSTARRLIEAGSVSVDGTVAEAPAARPDPQSTLLIGVPEPPDSLQPEDVGFSVMFEDEHLAVVDKPAGVVTHPGAGNASGTLAAGLLFRWPQIEGVGEEGRWGIVHRLDRGTSGLLVVAKTVPALEALRQMIKQRDVERSYLALVQEPMSIETGTIDAPISRDPNRPIRRRVSATGRPARTHYEQIAAWTDHALLLVRLETGRTHQIRVHLAAIEHPVIGDRAYGAGADAADPGRPWLHSWKLSFQHPITDQAVAYNVPLPPDLESSLQVLGEPMAGAVPPETVSNKQ